MIRGRLNKCCTLLIVTALFVLIIVSCSSRPPKYSTGGEDIRTTLNTSLYLDRQLKKAENATPSKSVQNDLLPPLTIKIPDSSTQTAEHHFDVAVSDMPAKSFFLGLVSGTNYNMVVSPSVTGNITLNLKNVTIDEALNSVRDMYGYEYKKTDVGYEILSTEMTTRIFNINYLNINRNGQSQTQLISTDITNPSSTASSSTYGTTGTSGTPTSNAASPSGSGTLLITKAQNDFWTTLTKNLETLIGTQNGRWIIANPQAGIVMVHAYPKELHEVNNYLKNLEGNLQREVIIEAKILEITLSDEYQAGINWKILGAEQNGTVGLSSDFLNSGQMFKLNIGKSKTDFNTVVKLLAQQGNVQVLSSPHISTINNQEAVIKVGNDQFFVTGYTSNVTPTGSTNTTSQSVALNPFFSGITLDVTPQISDAGRVTLYIHPSISKVKSKNTSIQLSGSSGSSQTLILPLATSSIRESDDVVNAENGQIIVIGGLMQNSTSETVAGTPPLSKLPELGTLARDTNQVSEKTELVILLRAIVVDRDKTWIKRLSAESSNFEKFQRGYHVGGLPEDFGTEGEMPKYPKHRAIDAS